MTSRFPGRCRAAACLHGGRFPAGTRIAWVSKGIAYHSDCWAAEGGASSDEPAAVEPTPIPATSDALDGLARVLAPLVATHVKAGVDGLSAELYDEIDERIQTVCAELMAPAPVEIHVGTLPAVVVEHAHPLLPQLIARLHMRRHVYLWGDPGSGKTHAAHQASHVLGLDWGYISLNPMSSPTRVEGFVDAQGRFSDTQFTRLYEHGGVFLFDELDNANPALLTALNSALENGSADIGGKNVQRHSDFICVGTGNTPGRGGTWGHSDRRAFDAATADRFFYLEWPIDEKLERSLVLQTNPAAGAWLAWVREVRAYVTDRSHGIQGVHITPRGAVNGAAELAALTTDLAPLAGIAEGYLFKGAGAEIVNRILAACPLPSDPRGAIAEQEQAA